MTRGGIVLDEFRRLALFTSGVAELTRHRAEQLVRELVQSGEVRRDQASSLVKMVLDLGKQNRQEIGQMIRSEIRNQISSLGLATERDLERLERRLARVEERQKAARTSDTKPARKKAKAPKKTAASSKKTTVRKKTSAKGAVARPRADGAGPVGPTSSQPPRP